MYTEGLAYMYTFMYERQDASSYSTYIYVQDEPLIVSETSSSKISSLRRNAAAGPIKLQSRTEKECI